MLITAKINNKSLNVSLATITMLPLIQGKQMYKTNTASETQLQLLSCQLRCTINPEEPSVYVLGKTSVLEQPLV